MQNNGVGDHQNKKFFHGQFCCLITFNEGHQGLLKLYMHLRWIWGFSMEEKKGAVLCCIASEKSSVSKFSLREFDISYIMLYYIVNECIMVA